MIFKPKKVSFTTVREALAQIKDPSKGLDLVTLGAVKGLKIKDGVVQFTVRLGVLGSQAAAIQTECEDKVRALEGVKEVKVGVDSAPQPATPHAHTGKPHSHGPAKGSPPRVALPNIKHMIAVASGKGGVGKSTVTVNLAIALQQQGYRVGLLDADVYGPSIPTMLGLFERANATDTHLVPLTKFGLKIISMGFLVPEDQPVVWRGPMVHSALSQLMVQVDWGNLDFLLVDMPPGTGDAQLTMSQSAPLSGAIIVTTPQQVSLVDAQKGMQMFQNVNVPILGVVENMSGFVCGSCGDVTEVFKAGAGSRLAAKASAPLLGSIPMDPSVAQSGDAGVPVVMQSPESPVAQVFADIARQVASNFESVEPAAHFEPVGLQWQT